MKKSIIYISLFIALLGLCSCSMKEQFDMVSSESTIQFVPRITGFNGVDVATKADGDAPAFETDVYTAYLLIFDNNGNRVYFASVDEDNGSWSQKVTMTNLTSGTACFIANVPQTFAEGIATITDLNSAVLTLTYATYSEAGGYLGVPKLSVNGEYKLCLPMFGSTQISNMTHNHTFSIPVKRLFAKISVDLSLNVNLSDLQSAIQTLTNYELSYFNLHNLPNKVRLVEDANSESTWKDGSGNPATFQSADVDAKIYNSTSSMEQKSYSFDCYVPEFYLNPKSGWTNDQRYKPLNKPDGTYPIYLELVGQYNAYAISPTDINYKVYLGSDNVSNFSLSRNTHYNNVLTIKGTNQNSTTQDNLDHRVTSSTINNPVAKAGKAANCYIIAEPGEYTIPAYKGAYNNLNEGVFCMEGKNLSEYETRVEVLANVVEYESITSISFSIPPTYDPETNTISFTVNKMLADNWVPNGSVIMALQYRKKGTTTWTTEWSWHLWFVYSITAAEDGWGTIGYQTMPDGTTNMMDRNLGVHAFTSADTKAGFYYKYGEHAPYLDPDGDEVYTQYGGGRVGESTPTWNVSGKSVTDPCPPGYRVPNSNVWASSIQDYMDFGSSYFTYKKRSVSWDGIDLGAILYPYAGRSTTGLTVENNAYIGDQRTTSGTITETLRDWSGRYRNIVYSLDLKYIFSALHGADNMLLYGYCNLSDNMRITQYQHSITGLSYTTYSEEKGGAFAPDAVIALAKDKIEEKLASYVNYYKVDTYDTSNGYQVRCVSEKPLANND